jgi:adenosine/AMP kinase
MDLDAIFKNKEGPIYGVEDLKNTIDTKVPLIGYAIGIPEIDSNIGGNYLESTFHKDEDDNIENEEFEDYIEVLEG